MVHGPGSRHVNEIPAAFYASPICIVFLGEGRWGLHHFEFGVDDFAGSVAAALAESVASIRVLSGAPAGS